MVDAGQWRDATSRAPSLNRATTGRAAPSICRAGYVRPSPVRAAPSARKRLDAKVVLGVELPFYVVVFATSVTSSPNACNRASLSPNLCQSIGTETQGVRLGMWAEISVGRLRDPIGLRWLAGTPRAVSSAR